MRIWSLHPQYLDAKGLVALWRETLLAKHVLEGKTKGYRNHPQLERFKKSKHTLDAINQYLSLVFEEATERGYNFDKTKFDPKFKFVQLTVTKGQIAYEAEHLLRKLQTRDPGLYNKFKKNKVFKPHPLFLMVSGEVESWEIITVLPKA
jgi:hypothetical protein